MRMKIIGLLLLPLALFAGCSHQGKAASSLRNIESRSCQDPEALADVLSQFANAVSHHEYHKAASYLSKSEQYKIIGVDGMISEDTKRQLKALNFQGLANNPKVDLVDGKLTGIIDCLPCLDQGESVIVPQSDTVAKDTTPDSDRAKLAGLSRDFYQAVRREEWTRALEMMHAQERAVFEQKAPGLSELDRERFRAIQECDLGALNLKEGKLVGVVLLLTPPLSDLWMQSQAFFDRVQKGEIETALSMLIESERKRFYDDEGRILPERVTALKNLDRKRWRELYLAHESLMGVVEAAIGYSNL